MPELKVQNIDIGKLKPYPNNTKRHPESQIAALQKSISEFGFINPILADNDLEIIAGHARYHAAKADGKKQIPVIIIDISKDKAKKLRIADNRIAELGEWDNDLLRDEIAGWSPEELTVTGWNTEDFSQLPDPERDAQIHEAPEREKMSFVAPIIIEPTQAESLKWKNFKKENNLRDDHEAFALLLEGAEC